MKSPLVAPKSDEGRIPAEDQARIEWMRKLILATHVSITDWENQFINDFRQSPRPLTPGQRNCVDAMITHYDELI